MSFLIRRNLPLAWAGWYDSFDRAIENPVKRPWVHLGDGTVADINSLHELHIPQNFGTVNGGGESYEFQPFTPNWGLEYEVWFPVEGLAAQSLAVYFTDSWSKIGGTFLNCVGIRLMHAPAIGGDLIQYVEFENVMTVTGTPFAWSSPVGYFGNSITLKLWIENDEWVRVWLNNIYVGSKMISPTFKLGPGRRCVRFLNGALCDAWIRWIDHYDRTSSIPPKTVWTSIFYDDFNRSDGVVDNGWTQIGTDAAIQNNSWSTTGTTDGSRGLIRDTGITGGKVRVEATVGGNIGPNGNADSSLVLCSNAAGTQGLSANIFSNKVYLSRFSSALSGNPPTFTDFDSVTSGVTVTSGDVLAFSVHDGIGWLEKNGTPILYAGNIHGVVPATNSYAGLRVERASSNNSNSWNDVRIYSGI
ncbi:hypothetical protein [Nocardia niwae]|uniref:hypothetical protein n=1 Tax=Nocardia niwae TaxID=626084 RepID=UPI0012F50CDE|nr:hypothetical protein [Nocardia niwae]